MTGRWRSSGRETSSDPDTHAKPERAPASAHPRTNRLWAELMQRSFGFDVLACPRCGGRLRLIALIEEVRVIRRILGHLGLPTKVPAACPGRPPPIPFEPLDRFDRYVDDGLAAP